MIVRREYDTFSATARCPASIESVLRWIAGAAEDEERPGRRTIVVELEDGAWAWWPHRPHTVFNGPGRMVYERLPDARVFGFFVPPDPEVERLVEVLTEVRRGA